jgi:hypothetical protein
MTAATLHSKYRNAEIEQNNVEIDFGVVPLGDTTNLKKIQN